MNVNDLIPNGATIAVCVEEDENGDGYFSYAPGLKGLYADGNTEEDAVKAAVELIPVYLESLQIRNEPIPENEHVIVHRPENRARNTSN